MNNNLYIKILFYIYLLIIKILYLINIDESIIYNNFFIYNYTIFDQ